MPTILSSTLPPAEAVAALKAWLAIGTPGEDALLGELVLTALALCEAYTGQRPLSATIEERVPGDAHWHPLGVRPVNAITDVVAVTETGESPLAPDRYEIDIDLTGIGRVRAKSAAGETIHARYDAGLAASWPALPDAIRHGIVRLAASLYRSRGDNSAAPPPSAVAALWRPFRTIGIGA